MPKKIYLGDGVYAFFDGYQIALRCDCMSEPNTIFLEPSVLRNLNKFYEHCLDNAPKELLDVLDETIGGG